MTHYSPQSPRRRFLKQLVLAVSFVAVARTGNAFAWMQATGKKKKPTDREICDGKFTLAVEEGLQAKPIGEVVVGLGRSFVGTPYAARTLEQPGAERLVVNLRALDCVTFVENVLALSRCVKRNTPSFDAYCRELELIRYRAGRLDGYPSRLHYFSDWIADNEQKRIVRDMTKELGGRRFKKKIDFMSTHPRSYRQLSSGAVLQAIRTQEEEITARDQHFIPKEELTRRPVDIRSGDIIAITTATPGLDVVHTGIAVQTDGVLKYLHAPLSTGSVRMTTQSLAEYLASYENHTGVMVARPLEPGA